MLDADLDALPERERLIVKHYNERLTISHDTNLEFETKLTFGQRLADKVASFGGSGTFISIFGLILLCWIALNSILLARSNATFAPYPYILLNLFLSMLAAIPAATGSLTEPWSKPSFKLGIHFLNAFSVSI